MTDGSEWCKDVMDEAYISIPFQEEKLNPAEWREEFDILGVKHGIYIPVSSKNDELEPIEGDHELATLDVKDEAYIPAPFNEEEFEPVEWSHVLATLDTCTLNHGIKFCDEEGYDIIPIKMVQVLDDPREKALVTAQKRRKGMQRRKRAQILMVSQEENKDKEPEIIPPFLLDMHDLSRRQVMQCGQKL